ncbi:MAG TPA: hypothetical protein VMI31_00395 [Fimbriimonadaceae bacterium]|nr:hypothetical protein [Fimbriimonadaceae bacterium]
MDYLVTAADGKEYGPVTIDQLRDWVGQDRIRPDTTLKNFHTGQMMLASAVPGLFGPSAPPPVTDWSQPPQVYPRNYQQVARPVDSGVGVFIGVLIRSGLGILLFFALHGIGLIVTGYGLFYAIRSMSRGHKFGIASVVVASLAFIAVLIGWIIRLQSGEGL